MYKRYADFSQAILKPGRNAAAAFALILLANVVHAQSFQVSMNHPVSPNQLDTHGRISSLSFPETLRVLVAMVEFQTDLEPRTTGNGTFDLTVTPQAVIDPPPHNRSYAVNHVIFAENYFRKVSNGKLIVKATVLDSIYTLAQPMVYYSPGRASQNNYELGLLTQDVWHTVDSLTTGINFQAYNAFMILHAGVGRDVDLSSQFGYDPGPFDIPSVYLNLQSLKKMFGASFDGVPVQAGTFLVTNSLIIPETESRVLNTGLGNALLQLGINGLICASIGSHLGLPDLFNTKNGRSGIGRFGLMDGQSIFSWNGVFPPEPSAWEKYFLGWVDPIVVPPRSAVYDLPAVTLTPLVDTVYRIPISAKEYFLVENRNRDANRGGDTVTLVRNDSIIQRTFVRDTTNFNAFDQDAIYGVVIDVDEFDWSLPGGTNTRTGEWFDGGILIWHIDENVIEANYAADAVNANPNRRGVNLMEADGSQDIGIIYQLIDPGFGSEDGTQLDYWYHGNKATPRILSNEFTPASNPASLSNDYANSHIYMSNFSDRGPRMTATIRLGDDQIKPLAGFPKNLGSAPGASAMLPADLDGDGVDELVISTTGKKSSGDATFIGDGKILAMRQDGSSFFPTSDSLPIFESDAALSFNLPAAVDYDGDGRMDIATTRHRTLDDTSLTQQPFVFAPQDTNNDGNGDVLFGGPVVPILGKFSSVLASRNELAWFGNGRLFVSYGGAAHSILEQSIGRFTTAAAYGTTGRFVAFNGDSLTLVALQPPDQWVMALGTSPSGSPAIADLNGDDSLEVIALSSDGKVFAVDYAGRMLAHFPADVHQPISCSPAIADVDGDGKKDIVFSAGSYLYAINGSGVPLDYFPIKVPTKQQVMSSPVIGDIDGDGRVDLLVGTQEGLLIGYNSRGVMIPGFPLQTGGKLLASPTIFRSAAGIVCIAIGGDDHYLNAWQMSSLYDSTKMPWPMYLHDRRHSGFETSPNTVGCPSCLKSSLNAYNWPNPVRASDGYKTHIRYFLVANATVNVKIFDLAGDLVAELTGSGVGGLDNELEWDVTNIQSGIYFGHVDAQGTHAVIKIAVVK